MHRVLLSIILLSGLLHVSLRGTSSHHTIVFHRSDLTFFKEKGYDVLLFKDAVSPGKEGSPRLPVRAISLLLPPDAEVEGIRILHLQRESVQGDFKVFPSQRPAIPGESPPFVEPDQRIYTSEEIYPSQPVEIGEVGGMSGYRIVSVLAYPVQYSPSTGRLYFNREISFAIDYAKAPDALSHPDRRNKRSEEFLQRMVKRLIQNSGDIVAYRPGVRSEWPGRTTSEGGGFEPEAFPSTRGSAVDYLVVTNEQMKPEFEELARWKTTKGVPAVVKTMTEIKSSTPNGADDAETLRKFIRNAYQKWGVIWVLLGGDVDVIPPRYVEVEDGGKTAVCDLYYADLDGNWNSDGDATWGERQGDQVDGYPDVFVGRAPVETAQEAERFVAKTIAYETGSGSHQNRILYLGENLGGFAYDGAYYCEIVDSHVWQTWMEKTKLYERDGNQNRQTTLSAMEEGQNIIFNVSHGNAYRVLVGPPGHAIEYYDAHSLGNRDNYSLFYSVTCNAADISYNDSFGEHFVLNPEGGGVGYIGSTWLDYPSISRLQNEEFFHLIFEDDRYALGSAFAGARLPMIPFLSIGFYRQVTLTYLLLGDPELNMFTNIPSQWHVDAPSDIPVGTSELTITVSTSNSPDSEAVVDALVCLEKENEVYSVGTTDFNGEVLLAVHPYTDGEINITVSKHNYRPYLGQIEIVATDEPHPYLSGFAIDDYGDGNGDGVVNPGETVQLRALISNNGGRKLAYSGELPIRAILSSSSSLVQTGEDTFATTTPIEPSGSVEALFDVTVDVALADNADVPFTLTVSNYEGTWDTEFDLKVRAPEIRQWFTRLQVLDDRYSCEIILRNEGTGSARGVKATTDAISGGVSFTDNHHEFGDFLPGEEKSGLFTFRTQWQLVDLFLQLNLIDAYGKRWTYPFDLVPPDVPRRLEFTAGSDYIALAWDPNSEDDLAGYHIYRSLARTGPFDRVSEYAVQGVAYYRDSGHEPGRSFFYGVTAVDSSGNESPPSGVVQAWTQNEMAQGWPVELGVLSWSGPTVEDVDNDGDKEIFIGTLNGTVYAFHHDGTEVIDRDGDPVTIGEFATAAASVWSSPSVADLHGDGIFEIVVTPRGSTSGHTVNAWHVQDSNQDGSPDIVQGWPTPYFTRTAVLSSPVLANVDGDNRLEIISMDQAGYVHVWEHDGTLKTWWPKIAGSGSGRGELYATPAVGNLDDDPQLEIVATGGNRSAGVGSIYVWNHAGLENPLVFEGPGPFSASPILADLDTDGELEIVAVSEQHLVFGLEVDGSPAPGWEGGKAIDVINIGNLNRVTPSPAVGDLDQDGQLEVVVPGIYSLMVWHGDGSEASGFPVFLETPASVVVGDVDGHGDAEIIVGAGDKRMYAFRYDGSAAAGFPISTGAPMVSSACIDDLDGDGSNEVVWTCDDFNIYVAETRGDSSLIEWGSFHGGAMNSGWYGATSMTVGVGEEEPFITALPAPFSLEQNYPNPFNPSTTIRFRVPHRSNVAITVYDLAGRRVENLLDQPVNPGNHTIHWDAGQIPSGVYLIQMKSGHFVKTRKLTVLR